MTTYYKKEKKNSFFASNFIYFSLKINISTQLERDDKNLTDTFLVKTNAYNLMFFSNKLSYLVDSHFYCFLKDYESDIFQKR